MIDRPSRVAILAALQAEGLVTDADLAAVTAAAGRLGFGLTLAEFAGRDLRGRPSVVWRATIGRDGRRLAVVYSSESEAAAAFEALGRAILVARRQADRPDGGTDAHGRAAGDEPAPS